MIIGEGVKNDRVSKNFSENSLPLPLLQLKNIHVQEKGIKNDRVTKNVFENLRPYTLESFNLRAGADLRGAREARAPLAHEANFVYI